jgi:hypothetical protein
MTFDSDKEAGMNGESQWLFPTTPLEVILRRRPRSLSLFEASGANPWPFLSLGIGEFGTTHGLDFRGFAESLSALPIPPHGGDWSRAPLTDLLDRLAADHRIFTETDLPAIGRVLSDDFQDDAISMQCLQPLSDHWPRFAHALADHLREEEVVLFLRTLRYDSADRLGFPDPDFEGGSVRVFSTVRLDRKGHRDQELIGEFMERIFSHCGGIPSCRLEAALQPLLEDFRSRFTRHARMEMEHLLPRAAALERGLYDLRISGRLR